MGILCIREKSETEGSFQNYNVEDLINKIDCVLTEYGFMGEDVQEDFTTKILSRNYSCAQGEIKVRFVEDDSKLIPLVLDNQKLKAPIYIEIKNIPKSLDNELIKEFMKI